MSRYNYRVTIQEGLLPNNILFANREHYGGSNVLICSTEKLLAELFAHVRVRRS